MASPTNEDSRPFRHMPVRLQGLIGVPDSEAQHPVVFIMHGGHNICVGEYKWHYDEEQKYYEGFACLIEELARVGYIALSINVNAEYTDVFGEGRPASRTKQRLGILPSEPAPDELYDVPVKVNLLR